MKKKANPKDRRRAMCREFLAQYDSLERKEIDAIGWIALKFSCSRDTAQNLIANSITGTAPARSGAPAA